jgi:DNA-binding transcriptional LysR family regulator
VGRPTVHQLEIFCRVVELRSMTRAAEEMFISTSSVSTQLHQLEQKYLTDLLVRSPQGVTPTEAGKRLLVRARAVLDEIDCADREMAGLRSLDAGVLKFAASRTIGTYLIPLFLSEFQRAHPDVAVEYTIKSGGDQARLAVLDGLVEFAILGRISNEHGLAIEPFVDEQLVVVCSPEHALARVAAPTVAELARHRLLLRQGQILSRDYIVDALRAHVGPPNVFDYGNTEAIKQAAIGGEGVAVLPSSTVVAEVERGSLVGCQVVGFVPRRAAYMVHVAGTALSPAASAFRTLAHRAPQREAPLAPVGRAPASL